MSSHSSDPRPIPRTGAPRWRPVAWVLAACLLAAPLAAQARGRDGAAPRDTLAAQELPDEVAATVVDFFNDPRHIRLSAPATIEAGDTVHGNVAVLGGPALIGGAVAGSLVVINGDLRLLPGSTVAGDITVVGGSLENDASAPVGGELVVYPGRLRYRRDGYRIVYTGREDPVGRWGRSDLLLATGKGYNRVEGLPITFGPRIRTGGSNPLRIHALAIYRSEAGLTLDPDEMGYYGRVEQFLGGHRRLRVGLTAHSLVDPIEEWHLTDLESGLSTFIFHRDLRDHYEREGVGLFSTWEPAGPFTLTAETRWERHRSLPAGSPWSLTDNAEPWRPQPLVAEGGLHTLMVSAAFDTRNDRTEPSTGWHLQGRLEQALDSDLTRPEAYLSEEAAAADGVDPLLPARDFGRFTTGMLDLRRYNRVDPQSRLNFRLLLAGTPGGSSLPPQRQHALGGEGSLPGYNLFRFDCGARGSLVYRSAAAAAERARAAFFPRYGCDAMALLQAEYRGKLSFQLRWDSVPWRDDEDDEAWGLGWDLAPDWTFFVDAGRAWNYGEGPDEKTRVDAGLGVLVKRFGVYAAVPLAGGNGVNFFVRLGPRF